MATEPSPNATAHLCSQYEHYLRAAREADLSEPPINGPRAVDLLEELARRISAEGAVPWSCLMELERKLGSHLKPRHSAESGVRAHTSAHGVSGEPVSRPLAGRPGRAPRRSLTCPVEEYPCSLRKEFVGSEDVICPVTRRPMAG
ncbi:hypothetical protein [Nocardiopsis sp. CC223A]|uniref:hypothetical protein n=1 Tax=Nocardiopsis sp. CC223A TaxID=3044051 RepID=UPI00278C0CED|nr:hypothetical protein [Nocardiopsis sp. CC223A]